MVIRISWGTTVNYTRLRFRLSESLAVHSWLISKPKGDLHGALAFFSIFSPLSLRPRSICVCLWEDRNVNLERSVAAGMTTYIRVGAGAGAGAAIQQ